MAIIGSTVDVISSKKIKAIAGNLKIENVPSIKDAKATKIVASFVGDAKVPGVIVAYEFTSTYSNNNEKIAEINIQGKILYSTKTEEEAKSIEESFKKNKRLKGDVELEIINHILQKATLHALTISQILELPPVIKMPRVVRREKA